MFVRSAALCRRFAALVAVLAIAACAAEADHLRDAQTAFNEAATADNEVRVAGFSETASGTEALPDASARAAGGYARTVNILDTLSSDDVAKLQEDHLWGVALNLKALSYWRLQDYDRAAATAREFSALPADQRFPRDEALADALPGLIRISQAHQAIFATSATDPAERKKAVMDQLECAMRDLDGALARTDATDPVHAFLLQAELSALRNKQDAFERFPASGGAVTMLSDADQARAQCRVAGLQSALKDSAGDANAQSATNYWTRVLGAQPDQAKCAQMQAPMCSAE